MENNNKDRMVCYCFNYTEKDIIDDVFANKGESRIMKRIMAEKKAGNCQCEQKNPKGR